jgi:hypothetical protein
MPTERFHAEIVTMTEQTCGGRCYVCMPLEWEAKSALLTWWRDVLSEKTCEYDSEMWWARCELYEAARRQAHIPTTKTFWNAALKDAEIEWRRECPSDAKRADERKGRMSGSSFPLGENVFNALAGLSVAYVLWFVCKHFM